MHPSEHPPPPPHALCAGTIMRARVNRSRSALWICSNALTRRGIYRIIISIDQHNLQYRVQPPIGSAKCSIVDNILALWISITRSLLREFELLRSRKKLKALPTMYIIYIYIYHIEELGYYTTKESITANIANIIYFCEQYHSIPQTLIGWNLSIFSI